MSVTDLPTAEEVALSLTGFDEIAIEKSFGSEVAQLTGTRSVRALVFIQLRREGQSDADAYRGAMELSLKDSRARFSEPSEDPMPGEPDSPSGKGS